MATIALFKLLETYDYYKFKLTLKNKEDLFVKRIICGFIVTTLIFTLFLIPVVAKSNDEIPDGYVISIPDIEESQVGSVSSDSVSTDSISAGQIQTMATDNLTYNYVGKKRYWGVVRYYDYYVYKNPNNWYIMTGLNLTDAIYHKKASGAKSLSYSKSVTYSAESASNFSVGAGAEAGAGDMIKASVSFDVGRTVTVGRSYQASSTIQATIPKNSNTGYYKMQVCHNFYRTRIIQQRTDGSHKVTKHISMPYGESYAAVLYSTSAANGSWARW